MKQKLLQILYKILRCFTKIYLWRTKPYVIGVTGSVGKTSCRMIISQVLEQIQTEKKIYTSPKNFNSELGLIFSIFMIESYNPSIKNLLKVTYTIFVISLFGRKKYDVLVAEYGIDSPGDMDFLISVMRPDIGIITKLDYVHSENFPGGVQEYWQDKMKLLIASKKKTFFNIEDEFTQNNEDLLENFSYIFSKNHSSRFIQDSTEIRQIFEYHKKNISINLIGIENLEYTRLALDIAQEIGIPLQNQEYHLSFVQQAGRFSLFIKGENIFIDSSYNAGPESMKQVIENTKKIQKELFPQKEILYVLGDMREIGEMKQLAHEGLAHRILESGAIFTVGPLMFQYLIPRLRELEYAGEIHSSLSAREIGKKLKTFLVKNKLKQYIVLFKGSQNTIFTEEALSLQLTPTQRKNLPRQTEDWKKKKKIFFRDL